MLNYWMLCLKNLKKLQISFNKYIVKIIYTTFSMKWKAIQMIYKTYLTTLKTIK